MTDEAVEVQGERREGLREKGLKKKAMDMAVLMPSLILVSFQ